MIRLISLLLLCAPIARAAVPLEAMKASDLAAHWQAALQQPLPRLNAPKGKPVSPIPVRQIRVYDRFGWSWESDAQNARQTVESNLHAAGLVVLSSQLYREPAGRWNWGFRLEVLDDSPPGYPRSIESYANGFYDFESEARQDAERIASNLRAAGYHLILLQILRQDDPPWKYSYFLDYVAPRRL